MLEVFEYGSSEAYIAGERCYERVVGHHGLRVAHAILQPGSGSTGQHEEHAGKVRIPAEPGSTGGRRLATVDRLSLVLEQPRVISFTASRSPLMVLRSISTNARRFRRCSLSVTVQYMGIGDYPLAFADRVGYLGGPVPGSVLVIEPSGVFGEGEMGTYGGARVRGLQRRCRSRRDGAGRPPPQNGEVPGQTRALVREVPGVGP